MHLQAVLSTISMIAFAMSGCATAGRVSYDTMASDYHGIETQVQQDRAGDERAFAALTLERRALIRAVLDRNPSVEAARQAWRAALGRYRQAGAYEDPMISASFAPLSIGSSNARFGYDVGISQRIPLGSKLDAQAALAAAEAEAADSDYRETRLKLALVASELYDDYFVAARSLEIQAQHLDLMTALKQSAIAAYASGHAAAQDSLQAEAELARLEYQHTVYETQRDVAIAQINALLHREPDASLPVPPAELAPRDAAERDSAGALVKTIARRPDIVSAQARVRVARARSSAAQSDYYPDLTVSTSYNSMWDMPEHRWMAGVELNIPLQRERRRGAVEEASAMRAASESEVQSMTDAARSEVAVALRRLEEAERAVQLYEQRLLPVARDRIEAARSGFIASQNSFLVVIEAEHGLRSAELELQMARADSSKRRAELDRALGRIPGLEAVEAKP
jgi:cobalt-zinc-cadmium efflux system outer membrane protein